MQKFWWWRSYLGRLPALGFLWQEGAASGLRVRETEVDRTLRCGARGDLSFWVFWGLVACGQGSNRREHKLGRWERRVLKWSFRPILPTAEGAENFGAFTSIRRRKEQNLSVPKNWTPRAILEWAEVWGMKESVFRLRAFSKTQWSLWKVCHASQQASRNRLQPWAGRAASCFLLASFPTHFKIHCGYGAAAVLCF